MQPESVDTRGKKLKKWFMSGGKVAAVSILIVLVFVAGIGVGDGTIRFDGIKNTQNKSLPDDLDYSSVEQVYDQLKANYDGKLTTDQLLDGLKTGLARSTGDPYTIYMNEKDAEAFNNQLDGTFSGIGAELGQDAQGNLIVVSPIAGFPAAKAGIRPQDVIVEIDGKSTTGLSIDEAVTKIRGPKGTQVKLHVVRDKQQDLNFTITRDDIKIPSVKSEILSGNIGYMQITQFNDDTAELANNAAHDFKSKGVKGVILDLRGNPGGLLTAAFDVSSLWLPKNATVLQEKRSGVVVSTEVATGNNVLQGVPTAVLIDAGSASASEITAGALKDNKV
ncbi:MAG TPA: S41 family peptidase, partial [Candidatus Pristimantibacillus sp.]|nr:S41 family peptidase [Candidatus Pristimantibacillus sp.]